MTAIAKVPQPSTERRAISVRASEYNAETRELPVAFASQTPVMRWYGMEVLSCDPAHVDLSRIREAGRLLLDHSNEVDDIAGAVVSASVDADKVCRAVCKLSARQKIDDIAKDIVAGILPGVSCGYETTKILKDEKAEDGTRTITWAWKPHEISLVGVEADPAVGVGRSAAGSQNKETHMDKPDTAPAADKKPADPQIEIRSAVEQSRKDTAEILKLARQHKADELAETALDKGWTLEQFRGELLATIGKRSPAKPADAHIGLSDRDKRQFSVMKCIRSLLGENVDVGFEREISEHMGKVRGRQATGFYVPWEVLGSGKRELQVGGTGSNLVQTTVLTGESLDILRNKLALSAAGVRVISGLVGDFAIPKKSSGSSGYWVGESTDVTTSTPAWGQLTGSPNTVGAYVDASRKMLIQSSQDVEMLLRDDIVNELAQKIDVAGINGGGGTQPTGLLSADGINSVNVNTPGTMTHAEIVRFYGLIDAGSANPFAPSAKWLLHPLVAADLATKSRTGTGNGLILDYASGMCEGRPFISSGNVPAKHAIYGDWAQMLLCLWSGIDITVDRSALVKQGGVRIVGLQDVDVITRYGQAFTYASNVLA